MKAIARLMGLPGLTGLIMLASCARFQPTTPAMSTSNYTPTGIGQSITMKDSAVHYDPSVLRPGVARTRVEAVYGQPNGTRTTPKGLTEDVYAFNPDGSKFVNPQIRPRNFALAFFTMGTSVAVRQARLAFTERKLTLYHVVYSPDGNIESVRQERMAGAPANGPTLKSSPEAAATVGED
ncbi:MAG: hypothetical protein ACREQX_11655 [Candidatus Binataceae bacterium]